MLVHLMLMGLLAAGVASSPLDLNNPCPEVFKYTTMEKSDKVEAWQGTLTVVSDWKLHGMWLRIFFDQPVEDINILDNIAEVVKMEGDHQTFLIKNRDFVLKKNVPVDVKFEVTYKGKNVPTFTGYRLNGRNICPQDDE